MTLILNFIKLHPDAKLPRKAHQDDGAFDLTATEVIQEAPNKVLVKTGLSSQIPKMWRMRIVPRSSFTKYNWVLNNADAIIDSGYTFIDDDEPAEWMFRFTAIPTEIKVPYTVDPVFGSGGSKVKLLYDEFPYKPGDRFAQVYEERIESVQMGWTTDKIQPGERMGGFGSSSR